MEFPIRRNLKSTYKHKLTVTITNQKFNRANLNIIKKSQRISVIRQILTSQKNLEEQVSYGKLQHHKKKFRRVTAKRKCNAENLGNIKKTSEENDHHNPYTKQYDDRRPTSTTSFSSTVAA